MKLSLFPLFLATLSQVQTANANAPNAVCGDFAVHSQTAIVFGDAQTTINGGYYGVSPGTQISGAPGDGTGGLAPQGNFTQKDLDDFADISIANYNEKMLPPNTTNADFPVYDLGVSVELGGETPLTEGTYFASESMNIAADITLYLTGDDTSVFLFQAGTTLVTGEGTQIILLGGVKAENIIWAVGEYASLGAISVLEGSILAGTYISVGAHATVNGCTIAQTGIDFGEASTVGW
jgi:hypothetical protein